MARHHRKTKTNIPLCAAAVLLYLTVLSTCLVSGLFARYTATAQNTDQARVAKFSITGDGRLVQPIETAIAPGETQPVILAIKNESEVSVEYTITVTNETKDLPLTFRIGGSAASTGGTTFTAQQVPGNHTDQYTLNIEWPAVEDNPARIGMVDYITVTVTATQID